MESQSDSHSAAAAENPDKSLIMSTPVTTLPPSDQTGTLSNLTAHPDYYETLPILGCGCFSFGCLMESPQCCGCASESFVCCIRTKTTTCRSVPPGTDTVCICSRSECDLTGAHAKCKLFSQVLCLDFRCALPTENQAPIIFNLLCATFYFVDHWTLQCFKKASEL